MEQVLVTKICTRCKMPKELEEFPVHKCAKDGRGSWCNECCRGYERTGIHREQNKLRRRELREDPEYRKVEQAKEALRRRIKWKEALLLSLRQRSKERDIPFDLELEDIPDMPELCPILQVPMVRNTPYAPSADRIKCHLGYVKGNIQIISRKANTMKLNATDEELILFSEYWLRTLK